MLKRPAEGRSSAARDGQLRGSRVMALRASAITLGLAAVIWSGWAVSRQTDIGPLESAADRILQGETFELRQLEPILTYLDRTQGQRGCVGGTLGYAAIIRLYAAAHALASVPKEEEDRLLRGARVEITNALACSPEQAFQWYALFWVAMTQGDPPQAYLGFLERSYELGPHEAWIAYFRNEDALPVFLRSKPELQAHIRQEFLDLVRDKPRWAAAILKGLDEPVRQVVVGFLEGVPLPQRREFAVALDQADVLIDVPGVEYRQGRAVTK